MTPLFAVLELCSFGVPSPHGRDFAVLCQSDADGLRLATKQYLSSVHPVEGISQESMPLRGISEPDRVWRAQPLSRGRFLLLTMRDAERRGAAFLVRRNGRATELGPTLDRIPDAAVSASHKACIGWTLREDGQSHVWFSRGLDGPGVELARLASGTAVDVDCREQTVWVFNREGLLYRARADDLERFQVRGDGPWTYRGRCAVSVWKTDLVVTCGGEELDRAPVPTVADLADARVTLTNGLDKGGWIGFHAPEDDFLYVREVKGGRLVGDWRRIASDRAVESLSLTMSRRHLCAAWTDPTALHAEVSPTKMSCIPR